MSKNLIHKYKQKLEKFCEKNHEKLELVVTGKAQPTFELKQFYIAVYEEKWEDDDILCYELGSKLENEKFKERINRSLGQIGTSRERSETSEYTIRKSKPFLESLEEVTEESELTSELNEIYPSHIIKDVKKFHAEANKNKKLKLKDGRDLVKKYKLNSDIIISPSYLKDIKDIKLLPSINRNYNKYFKLGFKDHPYYEHYKPLNKEINLYDSKQGKKFYGVPGTWMFDIIYFSNHGKKDSINQNLKYDVSKYLIGINVNTRYAVARRIKGKKVKDLLPVFKELINDPKLNLYIKVIVFDGEAAVSSHEFQQFCLSKNIRIRTTHSGIHTQTSPIDRLCRTVKDIFKKVFFLNLSEGFKTKHRNDNITFTEENLNEIKKNPLKSQEVKNKLYTEGIYVRRLFDGETDYTAPIPKEYYWCDGWEGLRLLYEEPKNPSNYITIKLRDELLDIINYYNNTHHNGLAKILKDASDHFRVPLEINLKNVTPLIVNRMKGLELLIIKYSEYYNKEIDKIETKFNIGDKVKVYDCFSQDRGSLQLTNKVSYPGEWYIKGKKGNTYQVYRVNKKGEEEILNVSKYMLSHKDTNV